MANDTTKIVIDGTTYDLKDAGAKRIQTAVSDPTASGTATAFIDSISQDTNGVITVTKKNISSNIPGTAEYANKLSTARAIDGVKFDGSAAIQHYIETSATTGTVVIVKSDFEITSSAPQTGARLILKFTSSTGYIDTTNGLKIEVKTAASGGSTTGAKQAQYKGNNVLSYPPNKVVEFVYDGTNWQQIGDTDTTYSFDGTYNASTNKAATVSTVTNAINALDVSNISGFGANKTLSALRETDGKISASFQDIGSLNTSAITAGTLGVARGGTGASSFTAGKVVVSNASSTTGALTTSSISTTELGYLSGASSNIQEQINSISGGGTDHIRYLKTGISYAGGSATVNVATSNIVGGKTVSVGDLLIDTNDQIGLVTTINSGTAGVSLVAIQKLTGSLSGTTLTIKTAIAIPA